MINCNYLRFNENIVFQTVVSEKNRPGKPVLIAITPRVLKVYDLYLNKFSTLEAKSSSEFLAKENTEKDCLQLCYSSPTSTFDIVIGKIYNSQPDQLKAFCPYCLLDKPSTLDHYIGQTEFPEYSILLKNLVPCCYDCNQKKGQKWRLNNLRRFIHFYNDTFISNRFLYAVFIFSPGVSTPKIHYYLRKHPNISYSEYRIIKSHFKDLGLLNEYNTRANSLVSSEIEVLLHAIIGGQTRGQLISNLRRRFTSLSSRFGSNYWNAVMYETIANSTLF